MNAERRDAARGPTFRSVELVIADPQGNETSYPIILRDSGGSGLGGVYVGQDRFSPVGSGILRDTEGEERSIRIVWTKKVADSVHMVGFETCE